MELVRCISERKSMPEQITVGKKYWIDYSTAWKDHDGDEYAQVYLDEAKEHRVGELMTSHFETVYRYLNYGESLTHYLNSHTGFLLKDIIRWCLNNKNTTIAGNLMKYICDNQLDVEENMEKDFTVNYASYGESTERGMIAEYLMYHGYSMNCID